MRYTFQRKLCFVFVLVLSISSSGCTSIQSHFIEGEFGHPYAGTVTAVAATPCALLSSMAALMIPAPLWAAEVVLTTALDTVLLPIDLVMMFSTDMKYSDVMMDPGMMCPM